MKKSVSYQENLSLNDQLDQLKKQATVGLFPGHELHKRMEQVRQNHFVDTLKSMFAGNEVNESMIVDVLHARKGDLREAIEDLLQITQEKTLFQPGKQTSIQVSTNSNSPKPASKSVPTTPTKFGRVKSGSFHGIKSFSNPNITIHSNDNDYASNLPYDFHLSHSTLTSSYESIDETPSTPHDPSDNQLLHSVIYEPPKSVPNDAERDPILTESILDVSQLDPRRAINVPSSTNNVNESTIDTNHGYGLSDYFNISSWVTYPFRKVFGESPNKEQKMEDTQQKLLAKGLRNGVGENNCFLNVVIQSLYHLDAFRSQFNKDEGHTHSLHSSIELDSKSRQQGEETSEGALSESDLIEGCTYCALKVIFTQYEFSESQELPPDVLRKALSLLFKAQRKFQLGEVDDAAEAHDALLNCLHNSLIGIEPMHLKTVADLKEIDCDPPCIVHQVFGMNIIEYTQCECGWKGTPLPCKQFFYYVSAEGLRKRGSEFLCLTEDGSISHSSNFTQLVKLLNQEDKRKCKNASCTNFSHICFALTNQPEVLTIGLVWDTMTAGQDYLYEIMDIIPEVINSSELFDFVPVAMSYSLRGMICYYGKHYNAYFIDKTTKEWVVFDDLVVKKIGKSWGDISKKCCDGKFQPFVLFYEKNT